MSRCDTYKIVSYSVETMLILGGGSPQIRGSRPILPDLWGMGLHLPIYIEKRPEKPKIEVKKDVEKYQKNHDTSEGVGPAPVSLRVLVWVIAKIVN